MALIDWVEVYSPADSQSAFTLFHGKLREVHDSCFPVRTTSKIYYTRKPWLTECLRDAIKKKNKLYRLYVKVRCVRNLVTYKEYRNWLKCLLKAAEKKHYCDLMIQYKTNAKMAWKIIKGVINRNRKIKANERFISNDGSKVISNKFNDFFVNVGSSLANKIPHQDTPPEHYLTHWCRVTHMCVRILTIIGSDNGLSPGRRQAIIWTNAVILLIRPLGTYFSEILSEIHAFSFKKMHLKMSPAKWHPFCLGLNVLRNRALYSFYL